MSVPIRIAVLIGSVRADSINLRLAESLKELAPEGITLDIISGLGQLPFYDAELDTDAAPAAAVAVRERVAQADRILAVTPEHNGSTPAVLANTIDWLSRPFGAGVIKGLPFAAVGVSAGRYGGKWGHETVLRSAGVAGAYPVAEAIVSQSFVGTDVFTDPEVRDRFRAALEALVAFEPEAAAA